MKDIIDFIGLRNGFNGHISRNVNRLGLFSLLGVLVSCGTSIPEKTNTIRSEKTQPDSEVFNNEESSELESKLKEFEENSVGLVGKSCQVQNLNVCLDYKGGQACYAKYGCKLGDEKESGKGSTDTDNGKFGNWYKDHYSKVVSETKLFHQGSFGCAATASTALKLYGDSIQQKKVTNELESQFIKKGWTVIKDMSKLKKGDVVFTDKSTSNIPGTYSHVFVFQYYDGKGYARITDNNGNLILRNIGEGPRSKSVIAYRK